MQEVEWQFDALDLRPVIRWLEARRPFSGPAGPETDRVSIPPGGLSAAQPMIAFTPLEPRDIVDTYLDTPDWRFHRAGLAARLRNTNGAFEGSLKTLEAPVDALRKRTEIQTPLPSGEVQALMEADSRAGSWVRALAGSLPPVPLFSLHSTRRPYAILLDGQPAGEVVLDETAVDQPSEREPTRLRRVEVEVPPDVVDRVRPFVDDLRRACRLTPAMSSKFELGLLTLDLTPAGLPDLGPITVPAGPSMGELAFAVIRRAFLAFLRCEPGARLGEDIEALHDMRVAARRMRAALALFEPALPLRARTLREELRWIASRLGEVRDLDIQLSWIASWSQGATADDLASLGLLSSALEKRRELARKGMLRALDSRRYAHLVTRLTHTLRSGPPRRSQPSRTPALAAFPGLIEQRFGRVVKAGRNLQADSPPEAFHRLRIRCKRLRYAVENARDLYGGPAADYIKVLVRLQDLLGEHQDAFVAISRLLELLQSVARQLPPRAIFMMGRVSQRYEQQAVKLRKRFPKVYLPVQGKAWTRLQRAILDGQRAEGSAVWPPVVSPRPLPPQEG
jgi:CHAD domain-containing protein